MPFVSLRLCVNGFCSRVNYDIELDIIEQKMRLLNDIADSLAVNIPASEYLDLSLTALRHKYENSISDYDPNDINDYDDDPPEDFSSMFDLLLDQHNIDENN